MSRRQYSCGPAAAGVALPKNAAQAIDAAPKVKSFFHVLSPRFVCGLEGPRETRPSRPAFELVKGCEERLAGNHVDVEARLLCSALKMGTGSSTVQSPPAIETMPCGSTSSTPEVFQSAAANSLAQATGLTLLEQNFESGSPRYRSATAKACTRSFSTASLCGSLAMESGATCSRERSRAVSETLSRIIHVAAEFI